MLNLGDVVLVSFPFTNLQTRKQRPAIVISNSAYQQNRPDIILMAVTSQMRSPLGFGEGIIRDWKEAGLLKPSLIKPLIATLEQTQIVKVMGQLTDHDLLAVQEVLQTIIA